MKASLSPWYALYAVCADRERPMYLMGGFTPAAGTTPAQAAGLRFWRDEPAPADRTVRWANDRAALYEETDQGGETMRRLIVRYDDLLWGVAQPWFPNEAVHQVAAAWWAAYRPVP